MLFKNRSSVTVLHGLTAGMLIFAGAIALRADTCSYTWRCSGSQCASVMGGWSGTQSQAGVTRDQCEAARNATIRSSSPCTCTSDGTGGNANAMPANPNGSTPMAQGHNLQQNMVSYGANLMISNIQNSTSRAFMNGFTNTFLQNMFDSQAEAQRQQQIIQQQIEERRRREAEQRRIAEQQRIDAMFARLGRELKLEGLPFELKPKPVGVDTNLELKPMGTSGPEALTLKVSSSTPTSYGLKGLPGVYVGGPAVSSANEGNASNGVAETSANPNLTSGPGTGTTGPGIPGLPGIYLDRIQPEQAAQVAEAATHVTGPDQILAEDAALRAAHQNPELTGPTQDPKVQAFQQDAQQYDKAAVAEKTAEQQWKDSESRVEGDKAALELARTKVDVASQTAAQQEATKKMLAETTSDEQAAEQARQMFEGAQAHATLSRTQAVESLAALAPSSSVAAYNSSVVDLSHAAHSTPAVLHATSANTSIAPGTPVAASVVPRSAPVASLPSSTVPQLCSRLTGAQEALRRLMKTQNMHNEDRAECEKTIDDASDDALKRGLNLAREAMGGAFQDHVKNLITKQDGEIEKLYRQISGEKDPIKVGAMQKRWEEMDLNKARLQDALKRSESYYKHLDELASERDLHEWIKESKDDLPSLMEGVRQLSDQLLSNDQVKEALRLTPDGADYIRFSASIIDSGYDIYSEWLASDQIKQLNQNAEQYLRAVAVLQARIQETVKQLNLYKAENPTGIRCSGK